MTTIHVEIETFQLWNLVFHLVLLHEVLSELKKIVFFLSVDLWVISYYLGRDNANEGKKKNCICLLEILIKKELTNSDKVETIWKFPSAKIYLAPVSGECLHICLNI